MAMAIACAGLGFGAASARADIAPSVAPQTADLSVWGTDTTLAQPLGFGMDSAGRQYVSSNSGPGISVFASDATGNVPPIARLQTGTDTINSIAFDSSGGIWASARGTDLYYFEPLPVGNSFGTLTPVAYTKRFTTPVQMQAIGISPQGTLVIMDEGYFTRSPADPDCSQWMPRHIKTYDLPTGASGSALGSVKQVSVNDSLVDLDMAQPCRAYAGAQIAFDSQGNILVGGDSGNAYLLPRSGYGLVGSSTATPLQTWGGNEEPVGVAFTADGRVVITSYDNSGVGVRIFSASQGSSIPLATIEVSNASHTGAPRGVGVSADGLLIKFAAMAYDSQAIGIVALPAAPSASPSPSQGSGGGSQEAVPVETPAPTPTPTPTPTLVPVPVAVPSAGELTGAQMSAVTPEQLAMFSSSDVSALKPSAVVAITPAQIAALAPSAFAGFTAAQTVQLSADQVRSIPAEAIAELTPAALRALLPSAFRVFSAEQGAEISAEQSQVMPARSLVALSADAMQAMPRSAVRAILIRSFARLSPAAATKLINNLGSDLSAAQLRALRLVVGR